MSCEEAKRATEDVVMFGTRNLHPLRSAVELQSREAG